MPRIEPEEAGEILFRAEQKVARTTWPEGHRELTVEEIVNRATDPNSEN